MQTFLFNILLHHFRACSWRNARKICCPARPVGFKPKRVCSDE